MELDRDVGGEVDPGDNSVAEALARSSAPARASASAATNAESRFSASASMAETRRHKPSGRHPAPVRRGRWQEVHRAWSAP